MSEDDFSAKVPSDDGNTSHHTSPKSDGTKVMDVHQTDVYTGAFGSSSSSGEGQSTHQEETPPNAPEDPGDSKPPSQKHGAPMEGSSSATTGKSKVGRRMGTDYSSLDDHDSLLNDLRGREIPAGEAGKDGFDSGIARSVSDAGSISSSKPPVSWAPSHSIDELAKKIEEEISKPVEETAPAQKAKEPSQTWIDSQAMQAAYEEMVRAGTLEPVANDPYDNVTQGLRGDTHVGDPTI